MIGKDIYAETQAVRFLEDVQRLIDELDEETVAVLRGQVDKALARVRMDAVPGGPVSVLESQRHRAMQMQQNALAGQALNPFVERASTGCSMRAGLGALFGGLR